MVTFEEALQEVDELVARREFDKLVECCEAAEMLSAEEEHNSQKIEMMYCVQVLAYMVAGDFNQAKYVFRRIGPVQRNATLNTLWSAHTARWAKDHATFFAQLKLVQGDLAPLAQEVITRQQTDILNNIGMAYSKVSSEKIQEMLALGPDDCVAATARKWTVDGNFTYPTAPPPVAFRNSGSLRDQLARITNLVAFLENREHMTSISKIG